MRNSCTLVLAAMSLLACSSGSDAANDSATESAGATPAPAPTPPSDLTVAMRDSAARDLGSLTVRESAEGIVVSGTLRGLAPGSHGIHLHMVGSCEPPFTSAGDHWNPTSMKHGTENPAGPHLGDMLNIDVGADSTANVQLTTRGGTLSGTNPLLDADNAAIIVHASADDYKTDPSGNSGARIACGIVRR